MKAYLVIFLSIIWAVTWSTVAIVFPIYRELINIIYTNIILMVTLPFGVVFVKREIERLFIKGGK